MSEDRTLEQRMTSLALGLQASAKRDMAKSQITKLARDSQHYEGCANAKSWAATAILRTIVDEADWNDDG